MYLKLSSLHILFYLYFTFSSIIIDVSSFLFNIEQRKINSAWSRMIKREYFFKPFQKQLGCWPENVIPYVIRNEFTDYQKTHIMKHIYQIQNKTCLRWVLKSQLRGVKKYVEFIHTSDEAACHMAEDVVGNDAVATYLFLGDECFPDESVIHEMMHALGFLHEHQRLDRDCYVKVHGNRAEEDTDFKVIYDDTTFERWPYDKRSITHYNRMFLTLTDIDEPFFTFGLWQHTLGDMYGWWWNVERTGQMTCLDSMKIMYRYCGFPDFCDVDPFLCDKIEKEEEEKGCKQIYLDIASGKKKPDK